MKMKLLRYLFLVAEILAVADSLAATGSTGRQTVRGIRYRNGEFELSFTLRRVG